MQREYFEDLLKSENYLKGGTKESCIKAKEFIRNAQEVEKYKIKTSFSCVDSKEFIEAVKVLIAYAFSKEDEIPKTWYCDSECRMVNSSICLGECNLDENSNNLCPYFLGDE